MIIDLRAATTATCGAKAGTLGRLMRAGLRVPDGFVVLPDTDLREIAPALAALGNGPVAVRSSASTEDTAGASAAGQHDSFLGVRGVAAVVDRIGACRESLWSPRAVAYRGARGQTARPVMAVLVQRLVDAEMAGVAFTGDDVRIEAAPGLGDGVVQGRVTPGSWAAGTTGDHPWVHRVAATARGIEAVLGFPVDVEWALAGGEIWVLQARPVTVAPPPLPAGRFDGIPGSSGTATGPARVLHSPAGPVDPGDIIVCEYTDPAWTPLFAVAAAFVTETGGALSHAAIVAREHGIPAVLGVAGAMTGIEPGRTITVRGDEGVIDIH